MADKLTPQQAQAVSDRGGKLLVSAAAGSGKTKVLVDRLLSFVMDPQTSANLDDFLIITYTKAAAAELRGKIAAKLTEKIAEDPQNRHLQQQVQRLYLAKISTVHAFCQDVLRENAYKLDLPADFRVGDENECRELRERTMEQLLDDAYNRIGTDADISAFVDTQGLGRNDALVPQILLQVYDSARCHLNPDGWLQECLSNSDAREMTDAGQTIWGRYLLEELHSRLDDHIDAMMRCADQAATVDGWTKPAAHLQDNVSVLKQLRSCETWDQVIHFGQLKFGTLTWPRKGGDPQLQERIKAVRKACSDEIKGMLEVFSDPSAQVLEDLEQATAAARGMIGLVREFSERYDKAKRSRRILDFADLEHKTLDLLLGKSRTVPTAAAKEIGKRFREIMVDEYQDSNAVQDAIFSALTRERGSLFMVGDVKQSIYQFRLADPGIFLEKYHSYPSAEQAQPGQGRKIQLNRNFRSGGAILSAANHVFRSCMSAQVGGLEYGDEEALYEGIPHGSIGEPEVEFHAIEVSQDAYTEEAAFVANRVCQLLDGTHFVRDGESLRPIVPQDIVILLRSPNSVGHHFQKALEDRGIRCSSGSDFDLLQTREVATLRSLLQVIDNPRQDIPLLSVLLSPVFAYSADDVAALRAACQTGSIYDALLEDKTGKFTDFMSTLDQLRWDARLHPLAQLLEKLFRLTRLDSIFSSIEPGALRSANLQSFYQLAVAYEKTGRKDLSQFLEHIDGLENTGLKADASAEGNCVTILSIHKSKGLEFPVVFLCGLSRRFNQESLKAQVLCDKSLGLGLCSVDSINRVRYPTVAKKAIRAKIKADSISEEMRVLYVAMTRPKDRLIMTYTAKDIQSDVQKLTLRMDLCSRQLMTANAPSSGRWVLMAALMRTEAGELLQYGRPEQTRLLEHPWLVKVHSGVVADTASKDEELPQESLDDRALLQLGEILSFQYPYAAATLTPSKMTATERKGRLKDQEAAEEAPQPRYQQRQWRKATFVQPVSQGTTYGNAFHAALQHIRYEACTDIASVREELTRLTNQGLITSEQAQMVNPQKIARFFATPLGTKLRSGALVLREFKFSVLDDAAQYTPGLKGEQVLLQGVVDCALVEDDGLTVIDFKTDFVTADTVALALERYAPQIQTYASALERIYEKPVKQSVLYFFHLDAFYDV